MGCGRISTVGVEGQGFQPFHLPEDANPTSVRMAEVYIYIYQPSAAILTSPELERSAKYRTENTMCNESAFLKSHKSKAISAGKEHFSNKKGNVSQK